MNRNKSLVILFSLSLLPLLLTSNILAADPDISLNEGWGSIRVRSSAPLPEEVTNETQARALARDAAIVRGQSALLTHVLNKKTHSKKLLSEAEVPSLELQQKIRGNIQGARVAKTVWDNKQCTVTLVLDKSEIKSILRKN